MLAIGRAYLRGLGVLQDYVEAYKWFNLAASRGLSEAVSERDALAAEMSAEERAEARKLARDWKPGKAAQPPSAADSTAQVQSVAAEVTTSAKSPQLSRDSIREAQVLLKRLGYQPGPADGLWGPKTSSALRLFQKDAGMPHAGKLTAAALDEMRKRAGNLPTAQAAPTVSRDSILIYFASIGFDSGLRQALAAGIDVNETDERGWTALMHAVKNGNLSTARTLIDAGANEAVRAADGTTAVSLAHDSQQSEFIRLLSGKESAAAAQQRGGGAVGDAPDRVDKPSLNRPIDAGTLLFGILQGENLGARSALDEVSKEFEAKMGRKPSLSAVDKDGLTDLHWAAVLNLPDLAETLIKGGVNVNRQDRSYGATPLHYANTKDGAETAKVLIAQGAGLERKDRFGKTPLHYAAHANAPRMAKLLITEGAGLDAGDRTRRTPLHDAAQQNAVEVAEILIANGADLDARDRQYKTPLNYASARSEVAYLLIANGASLY